MSEYPERYPCDCCKYETLTEGYGSYEICYLCEWENDDNYSWRYPEKTIGGANHDYSLREASENFKKYYVMYRVAQPEKYYTIFKDVIEVKKKIIQILDVIEHYKKQNKLEHQIDLEYIKLTFAIKELQDAKNSTPYTLNAFSGDIQKRN